MISHSNYQLNLLYHPPVILRFKNLIICLASLLHWIQFLKIDWLQTRATSSYGNFIMNKFHSKFNNELSFNLKVSKWPLSKFSLHNTDLKIVSCSTAVKICPGGQNSNLLSRPRFNKMGNKPEYFKHSSYGAKDFPLNIPQRAMKATISRLPKFANESSNTRQSRVSCVLAKTKR